MTSRLNRTQPGPPLPYNLDTLKARISPGDTVQFDFRGQRLTGTVAALGRTRAAVIVEDANGRYHVPYLLLQALGKVKDHSSREQGALAECRKLLRKHRLSEWSASLDDSTRRAAACHYSHKKISLSRLFLRRATDAEILDTILHEIAHALAGFAHHHDAHWRNIARQIGCSGERCHNLDFSLPRWIVHCPDGCFTTTRARRSRGRICGMCRKPLRFLPWSKELARKFGVCTER